MGLSSKQVNSNTSTDHELDWSRTLLQTRANLEISKPSSMRRIQQQQENQNNQQNSEVLKCPRCDSTNTKFCYYNNYNKTQPRHFCRTCKRHWTKGGTLRNVPVGGGRKNKKTKKPPTSNSVSSVSASSQTNVNIVNIDNRVSTQMIFEPQNQTQSLPLLYQAMVSVSPQQSLITTAEPFAQKQSMNFPFPSSTSFDSNLVSISIPFQNSSSCFYNPEEFKIIGESSIDIPTTGMINNTVTEQPIWQVPITSNCGTDVSNNWNWEDIDSLVSTDHINLAWDDSHIKP